MKAQVKNIEGIDVPFIYVTTPRGTKLRKYKCVCPECGAVEYRIIHGYKSFQLCKKCIFPFKTIVDEQGRVCTKCNEYKEWNEYSSHGKARKRKSECKGCASARVKRYLELNPNIRNSKAKRRKQYDANLKVTDTFTWRVSRIRKSLLSRKLPTPPTAEIREWLTKQQLVCAYTGEPVTLLNMSIDHKIPLSRGGDNRLDNLCITTLATNVTKGAFTYNEFTNLLDLINTWGEGKDVMLHRLGGKLYEDTIS